MPTLDEIGRALQNADAAGDVEAATQLAQAYRQMEALPPAEGVIASAARPFFSNIVPSLGTAAGGMLGAAGAGIVTAPTGPGMIAGAVAGDLAGGAAGGALAREAQNWALGPERLASMRAQEEVNAIEHPFASKMGGFIGAFPAFLGGGRIAPLAKDAAGNLIRDASGNLVKKAATTYAEHVAEHLPQNLLGGARSGGSEAAQMIAEDDPSLQGMDTTQKAQFFADQMAHNALSLGVTGLIPGAQMFLKNATAVGAGNILAKAPTDAAAMAVASAIYNTAVHGKPFDPTKIALETGAEAPAFMLMNALTHGAGGLMPKRGQAGAPLPQESLTPDQQMGYVESEVAPNPVTQAAAAATRVADQHAATTPVTAEALRQVAADTAARADMERALNESEQARTQSEVDGATKELNRRAQEIAAAANRRSQFEDMATPPAEEAPPEVATPTAESNFDANRQAEVENTQADITASQMEAQRQADEAKATVQRQADYEAGKPSSAEEIPQEEAPPIATPEPRSFPAAPEVVNPTGNELVRDSADVANDVKKASLKSFLLPKVDAPTQESIPARDAQMTPEEQKDYNEFQTLIEKKGQASNKVKGVNFTAKDASRFEALGTKLRKHFVESATPEIDPIIWKDINGNDIRVSKTGTFYTVENGRIRTGPAFENEGFIKGVNPQPVPAEIVDKYGIELPEGYVKKGEIYVHEGKPTPAEPPASDTIKKVILNVEAPITQTREYTLLSEIRELGKLKDAELNTARARLLADPAHVAELAKAASIDTKQRSTRTLVNLLQEHGARYAENQQTHGGEGAEEKLYGKMMGSIPRFSTEHEHTPQSGDSPEHDQIRAKSGDQQAGGVTIAPELSGKAHQQFGDILKPNDKVYHIGSITLSKELGLRGLGLGKRLYLEALATHPDSWFHNSQAWPDAARVMRSLAKDGLIELHVKSEGEEGFGQHIKRITPEGLKRVEEFRKVDADYAKTQARAEAPAEPPKAGNRITYMDGGLRKEGVLLGVNGEVARVLTADGEKIQTRAKNVEALPVKDTKVPEVAAEPPPQTFADFLRETNTREKRPKWTDEAYDASQRYADGDKTALDGLKPTAKRIATQAYLDFNADARKAQEAADRKEEHRVRSMEKRDRKFDQETTHKRDAPEGVDQLPDDMESANASHKGRSKPLTPEEFKARATEYADALHKELGVRKFGNIEFGNYPASEDGVIFRGFVRANSDQVYLNLAALHNKGEALDTFLEESMHLIYKDKAVAKEWARLKELAPPDQLESLRASLRELYREGVVDEEAFNEIGRKLGYEWLQKPAWRRAWEAIKAAVRRVFGLKDETEINRISARLVEHAIKNQQSTIPGAPPRDSESVESPLKRDANAAYSEAADSGDTARAQELVDTKAKDLGLTPALHGTENGGFTVFDPAKTPQKLPAIFFTSPEDYPTARSYGGPNEMTEAGSPGNGVWKVFLDLKNPLEYDFKGATWDGRTPEGGELGFTTNDLARKAKDAGHDGAIFKNVRDEGPDGKGDAPPATVYAVFKPEQIKSGDAITRDDAGNVIPLDERFNPKEADLRFSLEKQEEERVRFASADQERFREAMDPGLRARQDSMHTPGSVEAIRAGQAIEAGEPVDFTMRETQARVAPTEPENAQYIQKEETRSLKEAQDYLAAVPLDEAYQRIQDGKLPGTVARGSSSHPVLIAEVIRHLLQAKSEATNIFDESRYQGMIQEMAQRLTQEKTEAGRGLEIQKMVNRILLPHMPSLTVIHALKERMDPILTNRFEGDPVEQVKTTGDAVRKKSSKKVAKDVEEAVDAAEDSSEELNKAQKTAESILDQLAETHTDTPGWKAKGEADPVREVYYQHLKSPMSEADFVGKLTNLEVDEPRAKQLWETSKLEIKARDSIRSSVNSERAKDAAEKRASRLIYATEEKLRQGSKDLSASKDGDTINKAFKEQVTDPMPRADFLKRLAKLNVGEDVADRLLKTAEREAKDQEAMGVYRAEQDAIKREGRRVELAEKRASQLIYQTEERFRQGSKDLSPASNKDTINKAFRDQVENEGEWATFRDRLAKLGVGEAVASRLFRTAERETLDQRAMDAYRDQQKARKVTDSILAKDSPKLVEMLNDLRRKMIPGVKWADIFMDLPEAQDQRKRAIFERLQKDERLQNLTEHERTQLTQELDKAWQRERRDVWNAELEKEGALGAKSPEDQKKLKAALPRLLRHLNLGIMNAETFREIMAPEYGVKTISKETVKKMDELAAKAYKAPEGVARNRILSELVDVMMKEAKVSKLRLLESYWMASVLSGLRTHFETWGAGLNGFATIARLAASLPLQGKKGFGDVFSEYFKGMPAAVTGALAILRHGAPELLPQYSGNMQDMLNGVDVQNHIPLGEHLLKRGNKAQKAMGGFMTMVSRSMQAADYLNNTLTRRGARAAARALHPEIYKDALKPTKLEEQHAYEQAKQELTGGAEPKTILEKAHIHKRADEILNEAIPKSDKVDAVAEAAEMGDLAAYQGDPTGLAGLLYHGIKAGFGQMERTLTKDAEKEANALTRSLMMLAATSMRSAVGVRFARFALNFASNGSSFLPGTYFGKKLLYGAALTKSRESLIMVNNMIGLAAGLGIYSLFADDERDKEPTKWLDGPWDGMPYDKKKQLMAAGHKPNSFGWKGDDGKIHTISYNQWEIGSVFKAVGHMLDERRYNPDKWNKQSFGGHLTGGMMSGAFHVKDLAALSGIADLVGVSSYSDPSEDFGKKLNKAAAQWSGGFFPNVIKDIDQWNDPQVYKPTDSLAVWARGVPLVRRTVNDGYPVVNILGDPVELDRSPWSRTFTAAKTDPAYQAYSALLNRGIFLPPPSVSRLIPKNGEKVTIESLGPRAQYLFQKLVGQSYKSYMLDNAEEFSKMSDSEVEKMLSKDSGRLRKAAADELVTQMKL